MPLYRIQSDNQTIQIKPGAFARERVLQKLFETNLEALLGVRFVASEFTTGDRQRGRIDTLGLDQDGYPTIIEYKKSSKENIINQGLFYLDWLVDHKGDFAMAAQQALGNGVKIDWARPRLILVAESFSDYDQYAVNRIGANIDLWTYRLYGEDLLYLHAIFEAQGQPTRGRVDTTIETPTAVDSNDEKPEAPVYTLDNHLRSKPKETQELFHALRERILELGEPSEIVEKANKMYIGYKHGKNFCEVRVQTAGLKLWLDIPYAELDDPYKMVRDVSKLGHYGTGQVELKLTDLAHIDRIVDLVEQSYQQTV